LPLAATNRHLRLPAVREIATSTRATAPRTEIAATQPLSLARPWRPSLPCFALTPRLPLSNEALGRARSEHVLDGPLLDAPPATCVGAVAPDATGLTSKPSSVITRRG
jgi:hypothetical protein